LIEFDGWSLVCANNGLLGISGAAWQIGVTPTTEQQYGQECGSKYRMSFHFMLAAFPPGPAVALLPVLKTQLLSGKQHYARVIKLIYLSVMFFDDGMQISNV
jgi:hypothetical protein